MTCFETNRRESTPAAARGDFARGLEMGMKLGREAERRFQAEFLAARPDLRTNSGGLREPRTDTAPPNR